MIFDVPFNTGYSVIKLKKMNGTRVVQRIRSEDCSESSWTLNLKIGPSALYIPNKDLPVYSHIPTLDSSRLLYQLPEKLTEVIVRNSLS